MRVGRFCAIFEVSSFIIRWLTGGRRYSLLTAMLVALFLLVFLVGTVKWRRPRRPPTKP